jgi:hypothetical protein
LLSVVFFTFHLLHLFNVFSSPSKKSSGPSKPSTVHMKRNFILTIVIFSSRSLKFVFWLFWAF